MAQEVSKPLTFYFKDRTNDSRPADRNAKSSILTKGLPGFLHLLTVHQWPVEGDLNSKNQLLVRLHHVGGPEVGPIWFDFSGAFTLGRVTKATEMTITANQFVGNAKANNLVWPDGYNDSFSPVRVNNYTQVSIKPGEVKTYILDLAKP